jgi:hypothetical protein
MSAEGFNPEANRPDSPGREDSAFGRLPLI